MRPLCRSHQTGEESVLVEFPAFARGLIARLSAFTAVVEPTSDDVNDGLMIFCGPSRNDQRDAHSRVGGVLRGSWATRSTTLEPAIRRSHVHELKIDKSLVIGCANAADDE